jgi:FtsZ-binding cell division protein ZapB
MNAEQIIKGLEIHISNNGVCKDCPYECRSDLCITNVMKDALALIKSLQGEIRGLNSAIETLQGVVKDYEHRNENLVNENKYLRDRLVEEMEHKEDMKGK